MILFLTIQYSEENKTAILNSIVLASGTKIEQQLKCESIDEKVINYSLKFMKKRGNQRH